jgi:hypothetical protein
MLCREKTYSGPFVAMPAIAPALRPTGTWEVSAGVWNASGPAYRPSMAILKIAPAFSGFRPSMAGIKKPGAEAGFFVDSCEEFATAYPAGMHGSGRRARDVMPAAM